MSHTNPPHDADFLDNPDVVHEQSDINIRAVFGFAVGLSVVVVIVYLLMGGLFKVLEGRAARRELPASPLTRPPVQMPRSQMREAVFGRALAGPQLLTSEPTVLRKQRTMEDESLDTYGWIDEKTGVARIPITEAKKLILQRGLPARPEPADPAVGTRRAAFGESSSGRIITSPPAQAQGSSEPKGHGQ